MARRKGGRPSEDREKTASERLLEIFEVLPGLYSEKHLFPLMPEEDAFVHRLLERLVEREVVPRASVDGPTAHSEPAPGFDPRRGVLPAPGSPPMNLPPFKSLKRTAREPDPSGQPRTDG